MLDPRPARLTAPDRFSSTPHGGLTSKQLRFAAAPPFRASHPGREAARLDGTLERRPFPAAIRGFCAAKRVPLDPRPAQSAAIRGSPCTSTARIDPRQARPRPRSVSPVRKIALFVHLHGRRKERHEGNAARSEDFVQPHEGILQRLAFRSVHFSLLRRRQENSAALRSSGGPPLALLVLPESRTSVRKSFRTSRPAGIAAQSADFAAKQERNAARNEGRQAVPPDSFIQQARGGEAGARHAAKWGGMAVRTAILEARRAGRAVDRAR
jgi:hypothetical protein